MKLIIIVFLVLFSHVADANPHIYSGKVSTFAKYQNIIAMHEHSVVYNAKIGRFERKSTIEVIDINNQNRSFTIQQSPILIALTWTSNGGYLIGVSNINERKNPNIVVYSSKGRLLAKTKLNCDLESSYDPFYCSRHGEYRWINEAINSLTAMNKKQGVEVCIKKTCKMLALNQSLKDGKK